MNKELMEKAIEEYCPSDPDAELIEEFEDQWLDYAGEPYGEE